MLILGWLIVGLISGFLFQGLVDDASRASCGPPRMGPYRSALISPPCAPPWPRSIGIPGKQERDDPRHHALPPRKLQNPRRGGGSARAPSGRDRYQAPAEVWRVAR